MKTGRSMSTKIILMVEAIQLFSSAIFCGISISRAQAGIRRAIRQRMVEHLQLRGGIGERRHSGAPAGGGREHARISDGLRHDGRFPGQRGTGMNLYAFHACSFALMISSSLI